MAELRKYSSLDNEEIDNILDEIEEHEKNCTPEPLIYGKDHLFIKSRSSIDITDDEDDINGQNGIETHLSSAAKLVLVNGYIRKQHGNMGKDITLTIYYFYDTKLQRSHLSQYYYRCFYICRPFGLAICQKLDAQYICMTLPNSPGGKLGLRAGSKILAYNEYIFDENDIDVLHQHFPETKNLKFKVDKGIVQNLKDCLPVTLYLKYDPIELLEKIDQSILDEYKHAHCNFFGLLHEDTLRWAIDGKVECFKINDENGCDVYSSLPIQSETIQKRISDKIKAIDPLDDHNEETWNKISAESVESDDTFYKIGHLDCGQIVKTYGRAGSYIYCVHPIQGWMRYHNEHGVDLIVDCEQIKRTKLHSNDSKMEMDSNYHFKIAIQTKYIRACGLAGHMNHSYDNEDDDHDRYYNLVSILNAIESREGQTCFKLIYFMQRMLFSADSVQKQEKQMMRLMNIRNNNKNVELLIITLQHNVMGDFNTKAPIIVNDNEVQEYIVGRTGYSTLEKYDFSMNAIYTSFRSGILMLGPNNQIFVRPQEIINNAAFRKIQYLIQGRRLSKITNLLSTDSRKTSFANLYRTLSVDSICSN